MLTKEEWERYRKLCWSAMAIGSLAMLFGGINIIFGPNFITVFAGWVLSVAGGILLGVPLIHERHENHYKLITGKRW